MGRNHADRTARRILSLLHGIDEPTPEQVAVAAAEVKRDRQGSAWLANGGAGPVPPGRDDLRLARTRGVYLGEPAAPSE